MQRTLFENIEIGKRYTLGDEVLECVKIRGCGLCLFRVIEKGGKAFEPTFTDKGQRIVWRNKNKLQPLTHAV